MTKMRMLWDFVVCMFQSVKGSIYRAFYVGEIEEIVFAWCLW